MIAPRSTDEGALSTVPEISRASAWSPLVMASACASFFAAAERSVAYRYVNASCLRRGRNTIDLGMSDDGNHCFD